MAFWHEQYLLNNSGSRISKLNFVHPGLKFRRHWKDQSETEHFCEYRGKLGGGSGATFQVEPRIELRKNYGHLKTE